MRNPTMHAETISLGMTPDNHPAGVATSPLEQSFSALHSLDDALDRGDALRVHNPGLREIAAP